MATESFIFTYPLVLMELTRQQFTSTTVAGELLAPLNQFAHLREPPSAPVTPVVNPHRDALYSSAWLDLSHGPIVLSLPEIADHYFTMPMYDAWTTMFAAPSTRTTGTAAQTFTLVGPDPLVSRDAVDPDAPTSLSVGPNLLRAPTNAVWLIGRIQVAGPEDYDAAHRLQDKFSLTMADGQHGHAGPPPTPCDRDLHFLSPPTSRLERLDPAEYFDAAARLLLANPPRAQDAALGKRVAQLHDLVNHSSAGGAARDERVLRHVARGMADGLAQIEAAGRRAHGIVRNGWAFPHDPTNARGDHLRRAATAWTGLGAMPPGDSLAYTACADVEGHPFRGDHDYRLHFPAGAAPPARASWSLAVQEAQSFFVDASGRGVLSSCAVRYNDDGSLDFHLQREFPGHRDSQNWLRTPLGPFGLALRLYWPEPAAIEGGWRPPPVCRVR